MLNQTVGSGHRIIAALGASRTSTVGPAVEGLLRLVGILVGEFVVVCASVVGVPVGEPVIDSVTVGVLDVTLVDNVGEKVGENVVSTLVAVGAALVTVPGEVGDGTVGEVVTAFAVGEYVGELVAAGTWLTGGGLGATEPSNFVPSGQV
mmetsp:Transcript_13686/g.18782  ORF Transcript_13686/g.18782 Transcript_13686/m.18782 type:complete len:149 (-) Transcript_13686:1023-1469(-)